MAQVETRDSLLKAATAVFVEKGYAGARVDEIARRAGANKAMIYYHFGLKQDLYQAVLLELFSGLLDRMAELGQAETDPLKRLVGFYGGLVRLFAERPALPRLMLREVTGGGRNMGNGPTKALLAILRFVATAMEEGVTQRRFRPAHPLLVHLSMIGPVMLFFVGEGFRARQLATFPLSVKAPTLDDLIAHLTESLARTLLLAPAREPARS
ncbi:MAG TPA: TetR/AcrR family transcriptional regulator [Vicinamibacteria bacterium]|nr:TetR/AcrR family transcriptional regulator [Vicinamibacteria bacterium]